MQVHLGFDMGIRNLAYCLMEHPADNAAWRILAWDNVDLLSGGASAQTARRCVGCGGPAAWCHVDELWCKGCATGVRRKKSATRIPTLPHLPCSMAAKDLKKLGVANGWATAKTKKDELIAEATKRYLMPWKAPKATSPSLAHIRRCMDSWLTSVLPTFAKATLIRLENQPVMKGPTMKSIQIMLFTLLGHRLEKEHNWHGEIVFVHAGTKTKGAEEGELIEDVPELSVGNEVTSTTVQEGKAYRARKKTAESETVSALEANPTASEWLKMFQGRSKKSDLADAFLMALRK
jgi:hypothetical protein